MEYRTSTMDLNQVYFYTATIHQWKNLLNDTYKRIIIDALLFLKNKELIEVYGYVIMPNHLHLLWRMNQMNGKERPNASLLKFTAHEFKKQIGLSGFSLDSFSVIRNNKTFEFWQRDSMAIPVNSRSVAEQKLNYIHNNPLQPHWNLCSSCNDYPFSSASFYLDGTDPFSLLTHCNNIF